MLLRPVIGTVPGVTAEPPETRLKPVPPARPEKLRLIPNCLSVRRFTSATRTWRLTWSAPEMRRRFVTVAPWPRNWAVTALAVSTRAAFGREPLRTAPFGV